MEIRESRFAVVLGKNEKIANQVKGLKKTSSARHRHHG